MVQYTEPTIHQIKYNQKNDKPVNKQLPKKERKDNIKPHANSTNTWILNGKKKAPICKACGVSHVVKHIITKCLKHKPN